MSSLANPISTPANVSSIVIFSLSLLAGLLGCASPGTPRPPSLHLPEVVSDLTAERSGDEVLLHWTTPAKTTDDLNTAGPMVAELCRATLAKGGTTPCAPVRRIPVQPGPSQTIDRLSPALTADPQTLLAYRITVLNAQEHSAGPSSPAYAAAGSAPPAVAGLRAQAAPQGALLEWKPEDAADSIELIRLHTATSSPPQQKPGKQPLQPAAREPAELQLRAERSAPGDLPFRPDAGGTIDATAHRGERYVYTAQRIRRVNLDGHPLEIRSVASSAVAVAMRDSFPPRPPAGLESIAAGQTGPPAVDLSWRPNTELDLAGYYVYRQELAADGAAIGTPLRLTSAPLAAPGFHDAAVVAGHVYSYTVTAIDATGNESAPSAPAREEIGLP